MAIDWLEDFLLSTGKWNPVDKDARIKAVDIHGGKDKIWLKDFVSRDFTD